MYKKNCLCSSCHNSLLFQMRNSPASHAVVKCGQRPPTHNVMLSRSTRSSSSCAGVLTWPRSNRGLSDVADVESSAPSAGVWQHIIDIRLPLSGTTTPTYTQCDAARSPSTTTHCSSTQHSGHLAVRKIHDRFLNSCDHHVLVARDWVCPVVCPGMGCSGLRQGKLWTGRNAGSRHH